MTWCEGWSCAKFRELVIVGTKAVVLLHEDKEVAGRELQAGAAVEPPAGGRYVETHQREH